MAPQLSLSYHQEMSYEIAGAQRFRTTAETAAQALTIVRAAHLAFGPIRIFGPTGRLSLAELERAVVVERLSGSGHSD
jgi:hypothetical protein